MDEAPNIKGIAVIALIPGLHAIPGAAEAVPAELRHYLQDTLLPTEWYPERDYERLLSTLANHIDPALFNGTSVWAFFGRTAAQRDIAGLQTQIPSRSRVDSAGTYRHLRTGNPRDLARTFGRLKAFWHLYHSKGRVTVTRNPEEPHTFVVRVLDYHFNEPGLVEVQSAYTIEAARILGVSIEGRLTRSKERGDPFYEWKYQVAPTPEHAAALEFLPLTGEPA